MKINAVDEIAAAFKIFKSVFPRAREKDLNTYAKLIPDRWTTTIYKITSQNIYDDLNQLYDADVENILKRVKNPEPLIEELREFFTENKGALLNNSKLTQQYVESFGSNRKINQEVEFTPNSSQGDPRRGKKRKDSESKSNLPTEPSRMNSFQDTSLNRKKQQSSQITGSLTNNLAPNDLKQDISSLYQELAELEWGYLNATAVQNFISHQISQTINKILAHPNNSIPSQTTGTASLNNLTMTQPLNQRGYPPHSHNYYNLWPSIQSDSNTVPSSSLSASSSSTMKASFITLNPYLGYGS